MVWAMVEAVAVMVVAAAVVVAARERRLGGGRHTDLRAGHKKPERQHRKF